LSSYLVVGIRVHFSVVEPSLLDNFAFAHYQLDLERWCLVKLWPFTSGFDSLDEAICDNPKRFYGDSCNLDIVGWLATPLGY
jgi:hypothetical protein